MYYKDPIGSKILEMGKETDDTDDKMQFSEKVMTRGNLLKDI